MLPSQTAAVLPGTKLRLCDCTCVALWQRSGAAAASAMLEPGLSLPTVWLEMVMLLNPCLPSTWL